MKILRVIASMDPVSGGPCEGIRNSIPTMSKMGICNEVVSLDDPDAEFVIDAAFTIYALGPAKGPYAYCKRLSNWLNFNLGNYNVVIIHGLWLHNSYGTVRVWEKIKKSGAEVPALFVMPHGMLDPYFQKSRQRILKAIRNRLFWEIFEKNVIRSADGLLFTCRQELLLARKTFQSYSPKNEYNVGYGILRPPQSNSTFSESFFEKCPEVRSRSYWLFLSRIHPKKGIDNLIKAYVRLKETHRDVPDLVVAGPGLETSFGKGLRRLANGHRIYFPGMLSGSAKWGAFYEAAAFILPSHQENFGIAVVEALACGTPVLISDKVNIHEEINCSKAGIVNSDNLSGTYALLERFYLMNNDEKRDMGENARTLFLSHFVVEKAVSQMLQVFNKERSKVQVLLN